MLLYKNLSDKDLFFLCKEYGEKTLMWRRKFIGLLPEVNKRRLFEKHGFFSIFEFAAKMAGVNESQVRLALNLEKKFSDKKDLHELLISGEVGINKLAKIASISTLGNQKTLAGQAKILPCRALETLARDERISEFASAAQCGNFDKSLHVNTSSKQNSPEVKFGIFDNIQPNIETLKLSPEIQKRLLDLQQKGIDINQLLKEFLDQREEKIENEKTDIAEDLEKKSKNPAKISRTIPASVKRIIQKEHGTKCAIPTCQKPSEHLHHTLRFAMSQNHDPHYIAPLCRQHHLIAHSIDRNFQEHVMM
ncbi:HNH endonuclease [Candidatus Peregrinibacteria bacterium]|nr:HNH endonuclease [Candidatus Peregrinibacteria bacterium]